MKTYLFMIKEAFPVETLNYLPKSLYRSRGGRHFYGAENDNLKQNLFLQYLFKEKDMYILKTNNLYCFMNSNII